ncbi:YceI family protein [Chitinophagaceae bacterium 26-R-25]|nr:YceI family protein [Chitinophagaceae bacterium 26-R-25]
MEVSENLTKTKWGIDPSHSEIAFKVKHLMITNVKGVFKGYEASIYTTGEDFMTAEIDVSLNPASVDTHDAKRDEHLKSADFFDVENFKQITFTANTYENVDGDGSYELYGDLTVKGITKRIKLDVEFGGVVKDPWGGERAAFMLNGKINRKDWGLNWNTALEAGGVLVSDEVRISCEIQLVKQA